MRRLSLSRVGVAPGGVRLASILSWRSSTQQFRVLLVTMAPAGGRRMARNGPFCVMVGDCGTNMAMPATKPRKPRPPLTAAKLDELALNYVGRFATSRAKLVSYLRRKLRERGWEGEGEPDLNRLTERLTGLGYVDDRAYAVSKARSLTARGYGVRRVRQALSIAGIGEEDSGEARDLAEAEAVEA